MSMTEISPTLSFSAVTTPPTIAALPSIDILRPKIQPLSTLSVGGQSLSNRIDARLGAFRTRLNPSLSSSSASPSFVQQANLLRPQDVNLDQTVAQQIAQNVLTKANTADLQQLMQAVPHTSAIGASSFFSNKETRVIAIASTLLLLVIGIVVIVCIVLAIKSKSKKKRAEEEEQIQKLLTAATSNIKHSNKHKKHHKTKTVPTINANSNNPNPNNQLPTMEMMLPATTSSSPSYPEPIVTGRSMSPVFDPVQQPQILHDQIVGRVQQPHQPQFNTVPLEQTIAEQSGENWYIPPVSQIVG